MDDFEKYYQETSRRDNIERLPEPPEPDERRHGRKKRGRLDIPLLVLTIVILTIGVIMVFSASFARAYYNSSNPLRIFLRQLLFAIMGVIVMLAASKLSVSFYRRWSTALLILSVFLLVLVLALGIVGGGSRRWISLGFTTFQPSEITKLAVVLAFSSMICKIGPKKMRTFRYGVLPFCAVLAVIIFLLICEPHLSASVIIIGVTVILLISGGTNLKRFGIALVVIAALGLLAVLVIPYARQRVTAWLHPENDPLNSGFQVLQSLYAIGSGGLLGLGLGQSRQKYMYLPEEHNDYIFSIVCEELGFIGAVLILLLFAMLIIRCFWIAVHANDKYSTLIVTGIAGLLAIQVFLNVGVVTNLLPSTGISLPFFSYGGTALMIQMAEMGVVLSVSRDIPMEKDE